MICLRCESLQMYNDKQQNAHQRYTNTGYQVTSYDPILPPTHLRDDQASFKVLSRARGTYVLALKERGDSGGGAAPGGGG